MENNDFLKIIAESFKVFLDSGSRSNKKLKVLHGNIAKHISNTLGDIYQIQSLGFESGKEGKIQGKYINKNVDILVLKDEKPVIGIGLKFIMQNYSQNSNNYFENMLGETANIRSNNIPYFQIFIIPEVLPYFKSDGDIKNWETFTDNNIAKYLILSMDNLETSLHTPNKTLIYVIKMPLDKQKIKNKKEYLSYYKKMDNLNIEISGNKYGKFGNNVIINDYDKFIEKLIYRIKSI